MASAILCLSGRERTPALVSAEILNDAEKFGYPVQSFKAKIQELTDPGPVPAYAEILRCTDAILSTQQKLNKIRGDIAAYNLSNPYMATHPALIEAKTLGLTAELNRIRAIIEFQTQIQMNLQIYNLQSSLPIPMQHHKPLIELMDKIPKMINEFTENAENLEWFLKFQPNRNIDRISTTVTQTFSHLQCIVKQLLDFYMILKKLYEVRTDGRNDETR